MNNRGFSGVNPICAAFGVFSGLPFVHASGTAQDLPGKLGTIFCEYFFLLFSRNIRAAHSLVGGYSDSALPRPPGNYARFNLRTS